MHLTETSPILLDTANLLAKAPIFGTVLNLIPKFEALKKLGAYDGAMFPQ